MSNNKQCIGIDISKASFVACICYSQENGSLRYSEVRTFKNQKPGFNQLFRWVRKQCDANHEIVFLMEATGVYYEPIAYHLNALKQRVHVVLPNTSKHYFLSLNIKTKTDKIDAKILSRFGVERSHKEWQPPSPKIIELRNLTRYYVQLQEQKTALNNIKQSKENAHEVQKFILQSNKKLIDQIDKQLKLCKYRVEALVNSDEQLKKKIGKVLTIKGLGLITVATVVAEALGFEQVKNVKQLVSYAGYDIVQRESGTSIKGKTKISKKGNRYIRNALYFPAMVSCRYNPDLKQTYLRIIQKKPSKMIGQVAIQRKLLILIYTLWKNNTEFITGYKKVASDKSKATQDSLSEKELLLN
jgi:transposase